MRHVDDGTLHALLDGALRAEDPTEADRVAAHLESCADCRARLERAGGLRDRAAGILAELDAGTAGGADAAPDPSVAPDFQEVLTRAGTMDPDGTVDADGTVDPDGAGFRWTRRLSWAATIVLALGAGWMVRDLAGPDGRVPPVPTTVPPATESLQSAIGDSREEEGGTEQAVPSEQESATEAFPPAEQEALAGQAATGQATRPAPAIEQEAAGEPVASAADRQVTAVPPGIEAGDGAEAGPEPREADLGQGGSGGAGAADWREASVEEAEARLGQRLLVLTGAEIASVALPWDGRTAARSVQVLPNGIQVGVVQGPHEDDTLQAVAMNRALSPTRTDSGAVRLEARGAPAAPSALLTGGGAGEAGDAAGARVVALDSVIVPVDGSRSVEIVRPEGTLSVTGPLTEEALRFLAATAEPRNEPEP